MNKVKWTAEINAEIISLQNARYILEREVKPLATLIVVNQHIEKLIAEMESENDI